MHTYVYRHDYQPSSGTPVTCVLPKISNGCKPEVTFRAPIRETRVFTTSVYSGDKVPEHITSIDQLCRVETRTPSVYTDFDTSKDSFRKIDCIKAVRSVTNLGLKEAKELVEELGKSGAYITVCDFQSW